MSDASGDDVGSGQIVFVERFEPPLESGLYEITVEQVIHHTERTQADGTRVALAPGDDAYVDEVATDTSRFAVIGERFTIDPTEIANRFPPPGCTGEYDNVLPHVVLNRKTLPWERTADARQAPWLAVLVFDEADPPPQVTTIRVGDLHVDLETGQRADDQCQVIDVPGALFAAIAPSVDELSLLTHGRTWSMAKKAGTGLPAAASFSVIVANRLPVANSRSVAHLVSLEGLGSRLPVPGAPPPAAADVVRLVTLTSWEFTSVDPARTFAGLLEALTVFPDAAPTPTPTAPAADPADPDATVAAALALGYWPVSHTLRDASTTVSWYRGPLVPFVDRADSQVPVPDRGGVLATSDEAMRYDPTTGMFDVSYAAAFQLGRVAALASGDVSTTLYAWKRANTQQSALAAEAAILRASLHGTLDPSVGPLHAGAALLARHVGDRLAARTSPRGRDDRMKRLEGSTARYARLNAALTDAATVAATHADTTLPPSIATWLGRLRLLYGVPTGYLVADPALLPPESIRFFAVDATWITALVEGAFSIGDATAGDAAHTAVLAQQMHADAAAAARLVRSAATAPSPASDVATGFLLRSDVVAHWPALEVTAYDDRGVVLTPLRMDHLAPGLLLFLADGTIDHVDIHEPAEGLHFGHDVDASGAAVVRTRWITVPPPSAARPPAGDDERAPGRLIDGGEVAVPFRAGGRGVIDVAALAGAIAAKLRAAQANNDPDGSERAFTAAELGLEMVEGVASVRFGHPTAAAGSAGP